MIKIDIAVIRLPGNPGPGEFPILERLASGKLRYVEEESFLGRPDLVLLSAEDQIMQGLAWLHQTGMGEAICRAAQHGAVIFGIGGGCHMLGEMISDPRCVESGGSIRGLGLLSEELILAGRKTRNQVQGTFHELKGALAELSRLPLQGEELRLGTSMVPNNMQAVTMLYEDGELVKCEGAQKGNIYGTCIRGIFEQEETVKKLLLALEKGQ